MATNGGNIDIQSGIEVLFCVQKYNFFNIDWPLKQFWPYLCISFSFCTHLFINNSNMKKLTITLACIIGMMFFASCDPEVIEEIMEQAPTVEFVAQTGYISQDTTILMEAEPTPWNFKFKVAPNENSESPLAELSFKVAYEDSESGECIINQLLDIEDPTGGTYTATFTPNAAEDAYYVVTVTVKDEAGKENLAFLLIHYANPVNGTMGVYEGTMTIAGHLTSNEIQNVGSFDMDTAFNDIPVEIRLDDLGNNQVSAEVKIEGRLAVVYGTINNNVITFNEFTFSKDIELGGAVTIPITLDFNMNMIGTISGSMLTLSGEANGHGESQVLVAIVRVDMDGTIDGTLTEVNE